MKMFSFYLTCIIFLSAGCAGEESSPVIESDKKTVVEFKNPIPFTNFLSLIKTDKETNPTMSIIFKHGEYHSNWEIPSGTAKEQIANFFTSEKEKLEFLLKNFDPDNKMEAPAHKELTDTLQELKSKGTLDIIRAIAQNDILANLKNHSLIALYRVTDNLAIDKRQENGVGKTTQAITDWTNDAAYMPVAGTSSIWTSGTLQKFWFDSASLSYYTDVEDGFEVDTSITPGYSYSQCGSGWGSNLPHPYRDTEAFDPESPRTCSVGSTRANLLIPNHLYWTWRSFSYFNTAIYLKIDVKFQPSKWCWWVPDQNDCELNRPWCMCRRNDMPIEWAVSYYYEEAPGQEVSWTRN